MDHSEATAAFGPYNVERKLGSGGMGVVYLATSPTGRHVAVKVIREPYAADPQFRLRFAREVEAARTVSGAFTAPVVDADTTGPLPWMATLFIPGPTLSDQIAEHGPLDADAVLKLAAGLAEALRDIHRVGLVHRDLKPGNILLTDDGPRVIDFGITRAIDADTLTKTGALIGTPPYMAPEQFRAPKDTGRPADIFALGSVLTFAATGHGPFDGENAYAVAWNVVHEPARLDGLPPALLGVVNACLAKEPARRPTPDGILALLSSHLQPLRATRTKASKVRHSRKPVALAVAASVALLVAGGIWLLQPDGKPADAGNEPKPHASAQPPATGPLREQQAAVRPRGWALWEEKISSGPSESDNSTCMWAATAVICDNGYGQGTAYEVSSGKILWSKELHSSAESISFAGFAPEVGVFYAIRYSRVSGTSNEFTAWDVATGSSRWTKKASLVDSLVPGGGLVMSSSGSEESSNADLTAWDAKTGARQWKRSFGGDGIHDYTYAAGGVMVLTDQGNRYELARLDATSGEPQWTHDLGSEPREYLGSSNGSMVFVYRRPGTPLAMGFDVVDPSSGRTSRVAFKGQVGQTMALSGSTLLALRADGQLRAVSTTTGSVLWTVDTGEDVAGGVAVADGRIYIQTLQSEIDCRRVADGRELWRSAPRRDPELSVSTMNYFPLLVVDKGVVYAMSARHSLFALEPPRPPTAGTGAS